ncbi:MAG: metallopeptidase TldD-related protein [Brevefilum sp.]
MNEKIITTLQELRKFALEKGITAEFFYHEEDSALMRFANSAISLNTNEHLVRLEITAHEDQRQASFSMITNLDALEEMKEGVLQAAEIVKHAQPLSYKPTIPVYEETFIDENAYDQDLAGISNSEKLDYFNQAVLGLESDQIKLGGIFSSGRNVVAVMNTQSAHALAFTTSDAQITMVLSHKTLKWEVIAEQSAQKKTELNPAPLHQQLSFMLHHYQNDPAQQVPLGRYDIVFGPAATAELVNTMNWIGFNGGLMKRGYSFLSEDRLGDQVFSPAFTLVDNPTRLETFPFSKDLTGIDRKPFTLFNQGVFKAFTWSQDDADEFGAQPTGHTVMHKSLVLSPGDKPINTLEALVTAPREKDVLYVPFIHYMNFVNPSKGLLTGSSRFGALLLKQDGTVVVPYNVRLTQSLPEIFGEKVAWMSDGQVAYNTSMSYGARNPTALVVPNFMYVRDLEISHANSSY